MPDFFLYGTSGHDYLVASQNGSYYIHAGSGDDLIFGSDFGDEINAYYGNDTIYTGHGHDYVYAGGGIDTIVLSAGDDTLDGGHSSDYISLYKAKASVTVDLAAGFARSTASGDRAEIGENALNRIENVFGSRHKDVVYGNALANTAYGSGGDDHLELRDGDDIGYGGSGRDTFIEGKGDDYYDGGADWDMVLLDHLSEGVILDLDDNVFWSRDLQSAQSIGFNEVKDIERFDLTRGDDIANSVDGQRQLINLEDGDDAIVVGLDDVARGGAGDDIINFGSFGTDIGQTISLYDIAAGEAVGTNDKVLVEFSGFESLSATNARESFVLSGNSGISVYAHAGWDTFSVTGGTGLDLHGERGDDTFYLNHSHGEFSGGDDYDFFFLNSATGRVSGGAGNDVFRLRLPHEPEQNEALRIEGNGGRDMLVLEGTNYLAVVDLSQGTIEGAAIAQPVTFSGIEEFAGSDFHDEFRGGAPGRQTVDGKGGNDVIETGAGSDILRGGRGSDAMAGGAGADIFVFEEFSTTEIDHDVIIDFQTGTGGDVAQFVREHYDANGNLLRTASDLDTNQDGVIGAGDASVIPAANALRLSLQSGLIDFVGVDSLDYANIEIL